MSKKLTPATTVEPVAKQLDVDAISAAWVEAGGTAKDFELAQRFAAIVANLLA